MSRHEGGGGGGWQKKHVYTLIWGGERSPIILINNLQATMESALIDRNGLVRS